MAKFDDASWHYGGDFPEDLPDVAGATHIGMFVAWGLLAGLSAKEDSIFEEQEIERLRAREVTPGRFLIETCDEKFVGDELSAEGEAFAKDYYEDHYSDDYGDTLDPEAAAPSLYHLEDSWANFDRLKPVLDRRLAAWRAERG